MKASRAKNEQDCRTPVLSYVRVSRFCCCDLRLDPMTLICLYNDDLNILKMYLRTKKDLLGPSFQKLEHEQKQKHRQTDGQTDTHTDRTHYHAAFAGEWVSSQK